MAMSRNRKRAIRALGGAFVKLTAAGLYLMMDEAVSQTKEADRLANEVALLLKQIKE